MKLHINKKDHQVANFLKEIGVKYRAILIQHNHESDRWKCDKWLVQFDNELFDFYTGTGHRQSYFNASGFPASPKDRATALELCDMVGGKIHKNFKKTGEYVRNPDNSAQVYKTETVSVTPTQASVLYCLALDADCAGYTFAEFCSSFGYDEDSRKAFKHYESLIDINSKLHRSFTREQLEILREILEDY